MSPFAVLYTGCTRTQLGSLLSACACCAPTGCCCGVSLCGISRRSGTSHACLCGAPSHACVSWQHQNDPWICSANANEIFSFCGRVCLRSSAPPCHAWPSGAESRGCGVCEGCRCGCGIGFSTSSCTSQTDCACYCSASWEYEIETGTLSLTWTDLHFCCSYFSCFLFSCRCKGSLKLAAFLLALF